MSYQPLVPAKLEHQHPLSQLRNGELEDEKTGLLQWFPYQIVKAGEAMDRN